MENYRQIYNNKIFKTYLKKIFKQANISIVHKKVYLMSTIKIVKIKKNQVKQK